MSVSIKFADGGFGNGWIVDGLPVYLYDAEDMLVAMDYTIWDWGSDTGTVTLWYAVPGPQTLKVSFQMIGLMPGTNYATVDKIHHKELRYRKGEVVTQVCNGEGGDYRFGFNGQMKDNELRGIGNSLDFGARMLDTRIGRWFARDPLAAKYPFASPYNFALNTPIQAKDPDGRVVIFINGNHYGDGGKSQYWRTTERVFAGYRSERNWKGDMVTSKVSMKREYAFDKNIMSALGDNKPIYRDGALGGWAPFNSALNADPEERRRGGYAQGIIDAKTVIANLDRDKAGNITESIKIVTHSMGGAYGKGYGQALLDYADRNDIKGVKIDFAADFAPFQPDKQRAIQHPNMGNTYQFSHSNDIVAGDEPMEGAVQMNTEGDPGQGHSIFDFKGQEQQVGGLKEQNK